jgi:UDPglucose 6-dehydrogenase
VDFKLLKAVREINEHQRHWAVERLRQALWNLRGKTVAVWGLAFKPDTDDLRNAPALDIIHALQAEGCKVNAHDPVAMGKASPLLPGVRFVKSPLDAVREADALLVATEWKEYKAIESL